MPGEDIAYCHACNAPMDVSEVEPFTNVSCPACGEANRVKCAFGPYILSRRHAIGGMSLVFVAKDATLGREVIVKILNKDYSADEKRITAFEEEARITALISHPNVVRVFTTGRAFDRFYIAMEFVTGGHFEQHITDRTTIPEAEALELAMDVVSGLKAAKANGLIHRDVKPGNILLDSKGSAKLVDFGLALVTKGGKATASEIWATPYYVPPETIEGAEEDFRSDIYAFGATMYHALAGKPPCNEESMDTKRLRAAKQQVQPLRKAANWLHPETCAIIDRCMAYAPDDRFRSYNALNAALRSALKLAGSEIPPPPKTTEQRVSTLPSARKSSLGQKLALASAIFVVLVSIVFSAKMVLESSGKVEDPNAGYGGEGDPNSSVSGGSSTNPSGAGNLKVSKLYSAASDAVSKGDFSEARKNFGMVRDHPGVLEPTGSWAACEAVIVCYMEGDSDAARSEIRKARRHIQDAKGLQKRLGNRLAEVLKQLEGFEPIEFSEEKEKNEALLRWLLCGLKNWDQGQINEATAFFKPISDLKSERSPEWLKPYIRWSASYLEDAARLRKAEPKSFQVGKGAARAMSNRLEEVYNELETRGRARFNVRCWQLELEKIARGGGGGSVEGPIVIQDGLPAGLETSLEECRFPEAISLLRRWRPSDRENAERRKAYLQLAQASQSFLAEIGEACQSSGADVSMKSRAGKDFLKIVGGSPHHLELQDADGGTKKLAWPEIDPESLITLHRALVKGSGDDLESLRRHEHAVVFDFLAGNRSRAREAAGRLSEVSELFGRRWRALTVGFKD